MVERVSHQLLRRPSVDGTGEPELQMTIGIEAKRERRLALAASGGARTRSAAWGRRRRWHHHRRDDILDTLFLEHWRIELRGGDRFFGLLLIELGSLVDLVFLFALIGAETVCDFCLLIMNRRLDGGEARRMMSPRMLDNVVAECVVGGVARLFSRLGRLEPHVVPTEVLQSVPGLAAESLGTHGRTSSTLAGEKTGGEGSERLGFDGHLYASLLADNAAAKTTDRTRTGRGSAGRRTGRCEHCPAEILFEAIRNIFPELADFLG
jgi:hypothetical protein